MFLAWNYLIVVERRLTAAGVVVVAADDGVTRRRLQWRRQVGNIVIFELHSLRESVHHPQRTRRVQLLPSVVRSQPVDHPDPGDECCQLLHINDHFIS